MFQKRKRQDAPRHYSHKSINLLDSQNPKEKKNMVPILNSKPAYSCKKVNNYSLSKINMSYIIAPGEKPQDYYTELNTVGSESPASPPRGGKRRVSTAHIESNSVLQNTRAKFAYDELVSTCAEFLGSTTVVDKNVIHFAESILAVVGSPMSLDSVEVKRRLEQVLPVGREFRHHRGMAISDKDCTLLCSLADRVINLPIGQESNLNIVDNDDAQQQQPQQRFENSGVHYIRHDENKSEVPLPKQLPSFVEANSEIGEKDNIEYDMDVTPYDSEIDDDPPIQMRVA